MTTTADRPERARARKTSATSAETARSSRPVNSPRIVVSLGTDHHPFPRLIEWVEHALEQLPGVSCLVQHGFTRPARYALNTHRTSKDELVELYHHADVVIVQGGPGSILDARLTGHVPLAVPRVAQLGEVVDDHQVAFTRTMAQRGEVRYVHDAEDLLASVRAVLARPSEFRTSPRVPALQDPSRALVGQLATRRDTHRARMLVRRSVHSARGLFDHGSRAS